MFVPRDIIRFESPSKLKGFARMGPARAPSKSETERKASLFGAKGSRARAIWVQDGWVYLFNMMRDKTEIWQCAAQQLRQMHLDGEISLEAEDRSALEAAEAHGSQNQRERREELLGCITPLLDKAPKIFESAYRGHAVADRAHAVSKTATTIHTALHRYWMNGMTANALLPRFDRIGTPAPAKDGKIPARDIDKVLGRPLKDGSREAVIINDDLRGLFETMTNSHYRKKRTATLRFVHDQILGHLQSVARIDQSTGRLEVDKKRANQAKAGLPTLRQYRYWYQTSGRKLSDDIARTGESRYQKDNRAVLGSSTTNLFGIGSRFEIDATPLDVGCVSQRNRRRYAGRPTLYVVVDNFSKMIVGIYLGFQEPSWPTAILALRNVAEDKVLFCNRFGLAISPDEWPTKDLLPARILADRGEFEGYDATEFVAKTGVTIENTTPYRGDMKGTVEKRFDMIHRYLRQIVPGAVTKDHAERGDVDYRRQAKLNLKELTKVVIQIVLYLNNHHRLESLQQPADMVEDDVPPIPRDMWNWAQHSGRNELRRMSYSELQFALLAKGAASTSRQGLRFRGLFYYSADLHREEKFTGSAKSEKFDVSWDPQRTDVIWRHKKSGGYEECHLTEQSKGFANLTFKEAEQLRYQRGRENAKGRHLSAKVLHDIIEGVDADMEAILAHSSNNLTAKSMKGAKAERDHEKIMERVEESLRTSATAKAFSRTFDDTPHTAHRGNPFNRIG